jgi:hypothetical protein
MIRSQVSGIGFQLKSVRVASSRLTNAVAASLAVAALSLCVIVTLTALSIRVVAAMPVAG